MKPSIPSLSVALVVLLLLFTVDTVIFQGMAERDRLKSRNSAEATINTLFASLRDHPDFGSAIESSPTLRRDIIGLGVYTAQGSRLYAWGTVPLTYAPPRRGEEREFTSVRRYIENGKNNSLVLLLHPFRLIPPPPRPQDDKRLESKPTPSAEEELQHSFFFTTLKTAEVVYLEIRQNEFWGAQRLRQILFPLSLLILTATVFIFRHLILRNGEYKRRIEEQKSLVVLGTAASTLAHEIKNPLLSIRLQTSILERFCPPESRRELDIINAEVDRLSALSYRVNEYLRDPRGNACLVDLGEVFKTLSLRLLGRDVTLLRTPGPLIARIDPERLISVGENILRNALESGGDPEEIRVELGLEEGQIRIDILDRGPGIPEGDKNRVFDPFFTTKSRGTGIGLAVAKRFVEAAGGSIRIGDREGGGCAVTVCLSAQGGMGEGKS